MAAVGDLVPVLLIVGLFVGTIGGVAYLGVRARRSGASGAPFMDLMDDLYSPGARRTHIEIQVQNERKAPAPSPDDE